MMTAARIRGDFEKYLREHKLGQTPEALYDPVEYVLRQPGKRIRPVLTMLSYSLFRDDVHRVLPAALAIEYFHNFTLVHDDIMDQAGLRRGRETVHMRYGLNSAILTGDLMLIKSFALMHSVAAGDAEREILDAFADTAQQICEGQQMDMDFEAREDLPVAEYLMMVEKKTAALLGCAMYIGALCAGCRPEQADVLYQAGVGIGKAFQIRDDVLDAFGDEELVGKRRGGDIIRKKKSVLFALAWESSTPAGRNSLSELYNKDMPNPEVKIQQVLRLFDKYDVRDRADNLGVHIFRSAMEAMDTLTGTNAQTAVLRDFLTDILNRSA